MIFDVTIDLHFDCIRFSPGTQELEVKPTDNTKLLSTADLSGL
jgi:hypothetical protein